MPLQNRVTPQGEIVAVAARGTMMGNRGGRIHEADRTLGRRRWASRAWICCRLERDGRRRTVMGPASYTELFFLDEATALAAGHRPCFECRRNDAGRFAAAWARAHGLERPPRAGEMDRVLHRERRAATGAATGWMARLDTLPPGAFVQLADSAALLWGGGLRLWSPSGYLTLVRVDPEATVPVLTPPSMVRVLGAGYQPVVHCTAGGPGALAAGAASGRPA